jgi:hypothetical protein
MDKASTQLSTVIDSIYSQITSHNDPSVIYISVGCSGVLVKQEENKNRFYHQFPPALQNIYKTHENVRFYCIFMDGLLENPVFMTQDTYIANRLGFDVNSWRKTDDEFMYDSPRITIYPIRNYIRINGTSHDRHGLDNSFDITSHLSMLHDMLIKENVFYLYHDFSGANDYKKIKLKFYDQIFNHEDHIVYGLGNGGLADCYPDLEQSFAQLPFVMKQSDNRPLISTFSMDLIERNYIIQENENLPPFPVFLINQIEKSAFDINSRNIIYGQIRFYVKTFKDLLIGQILYFLRHMIDIQKRNVELYINDYHIELFGSDIRKIYELYETCDNSFFEKIKKIVAEKFKTEFVLFAVYDQILNKMDLDKIVYLNSDDIIDIITENDDPYKWSAVCLKLCSL